MAGIIDLGGIDSSDVINRDYPQPTPSRLAEVLAQALRAESRLLASKPSGLRSPWP